MKAINFTLMIMVTLCSCKKLMTEVNQGFIGDWKGPSHGGSVNYISIDSANNGEYTYEGYQSMEDDQHVMGIVRCSDRKLKFGRWHSFSIDEPPREIDTNVLNWGLGGPKPNWRMKIEGAYYFTKK